MGGEELSFRTLLGGACIVAAMLIINLRSVRAAPKNA